MQIEFGGDNLRRLYEDANFVVPALGLDVTKAFRKKVAFLVAANSELDLRNYRALHFEKLTGGGTEHDQ